MEKCENCLGDHKTKDCPGLQLPDEDPESAELNEIIPEMMSGGIRELGKKPKLAEILERAGEGRHPEHVQCRSTAAIPPEKNVHDMMLEAMNRDLLAVLKKYGFDMSMEFRIYSTAEARLDDEGFQVTAIDGEIQRLELTATGVCLTPIPARRRKKKKKAKRRKR